MSNNLNLKSARPRLSIIFLLDVSGSMHGEPICRLNDAMAEIVEIAEKRAQQKQIKLSMRVIAFSHDAKWLYGNDKNGVGHIDWRPVSAVAGGTGLGVAIRLAAYAISADRLVRDDFRPWVILITGGCSLDMEDTLAAIKKLGNSFKRYEGDFFRRAIGIGDDIDRDELNAFTSSGLFVDDYGYCHPLSPILLNDRAEGLLSALTEIVNGIFTKSAFLDCKRQEAPDISDFIINIDDFGDWEP